MNIDNENDNEYENSDFEEIHRTIKKLGQNAQAIAERIAEGLIAPVSPGFVPIVILGDPSGRVLVAILPNRAVQTAIDGERDPLQETMKAFNEALKDYGPIGDIGV